MTRYILHGPYDFLRANGYLVAWAALSLLPVHRRGAALLVAASSLGLLIYRAPVLDSLIGG